MEDKIDKKDEAEADSENHSSVKPLSQVQKETQGKMQTEIELRMEDDNFDEFQNEQDLLWLDKQKEKKREKESIIKVEAKSKPEPELEPEPEKESNTKTKPLKEKFKEGAKVFLDKRSEEGKVIFDMIEEGKTIFDSIHDKIKKKMPKVEVIELKIAMAYDKFWVKKDKKNESKLKGKMEALDVRKKSLSKSKVEIEGVIKRIEEKGISAKSLKKELIRIDKDLSHLFFENMELESQGDSYAKKRDSIVEDLARKCKEEFDIIRSELDALILKKDELALLKDEVKNEPKNRKTEINKLKWEKKTTEKALKSSGMPEWKIRLDDTVRKLEKSINTDDQEFVRKKSKEIEDKILILADKVRVRGIRIDKLEKIKKSGLIDDENEDDQGDSVKQNEIRDEVKLSKIKDSDPQIINAESSIEKKKFDVRVYITQFNNVINEKLGKRSKFIIKQDEFFDITGFDASGTKILRKDFVRILNDEYYKSKKISLKEEISKRKNDKDKN